jgi:cardiolipin synthase
MVRIAVQDVTRTFSEPASGVEITAGALVPAVAPVAVAHAPSFPVGSNQVRLLRDGAVAHAAMLAAIREAKREILLEMYWIGRDHVGRRFREALVERALAGVAVQVIYDGVGSYGLPGGFWSSLLAAGGEVREFSSLAPWRRDFRISRLRQRDHRKNLVVDEVVAFVGGINLGDEWAPEKGPGWRDDALEVRGEASRGVRAAFARVWDDLGGRAMAGATQALEEEAAPTDADAPVRVLTNRIVGRPDRAIRRVYLREIRAARRSIALASAYFLPGPVFLLALRQAARRGVRVRVLVPARADVWLVTLAATSIIGRLLADGVEVHAYGGRVLHSKTAVFDERVVLVGSHNLDTLSWKFNLECDVRVEDEAFAAYAARSFDQDCADATALSLAGWRSRPWHLRLLAWLVAFFRSFL